MKKLRIEQVGFGTGRQKIALERRPTPTSSLGTGYTPARETGGPPKRHLKPNSPIRNFFMLYRGKARVGWRLGMRAHALSAAPAHDAVGCIAGGWTRP
jgi:hypothetical protein